MEHTKNRYILIGIVVLIALSIGAWFAWEKAPMYSFPLVLGEEVASWDFVGTYEDGGALEVRVRSDITRLNGLFGQEGYTDYELYVSLANQYELLGDGKKSYDYLLKALAIDAETTGLAWLNMGKLMERFGALKTARIAFDRMVAAQASLQYQTTRLEFLKAYMPEDMAAIKQAEAQLNGTLGEFVAE